MKIKMGCTPLMGLIWLVLGVTVYGLMSANNPWGVILAIVMIVAFYTADKWMDLS